MPTFLFYKDGERVDTFIGANPPQLLNLLKKHNPEEAAGQAAVPAADSESKSESEGESNDEPKSA